MSVRVAEIARLLNARLVGECAQPIVAAGTIEDGRAGEIGFLAESRYKKYARETGLSALLVHEEIETPAAQLIVDDVKAAWRQVAQQFVRTEYAQGIHPDAVIDARATLGRDVRVAAGAVIEAEAVLGDGCTVAAHAMIERGVTIAADGYIGAGARLLRGTRIGRRVFVDSGAVIGSRGFGYVFSDGCWQPVPQLGGVLIGDDVDIGANTAIDRGAIRDTVIEDGVKLDNLIQIGHNVRIGAHTIIAGNCVIAGSVRFGQYCVVGGASVFAGHIDICDGAQFNGHSSVSKSITKPGLYCSALTVMPHKQWARFVGKLKLFGKEK